MATLTRTEKQKIKRVCTPKEHSGRLEVPENIFAMWEDTAKGGRDKLFHMWVKAGGVKAQSGSLWVKFWKLILFCPDFTSRNPSHTTDVENHSSVTGLQEIELVVRGMGVLAI